MNQGMNAQTCDEHLSVHLWVYWGGGWNPTHNGCLCRCMCVAVGVQGTEIVIQHYHNPLTHRPHCGYPE
jgi:hypothetical protein